MRMHHLAVATALFSLVGVPAFAATVDLAGPATGYLGISNFKNSGTQAGIEGAANGLPDYPNYQIPPGDPNAGVWTAIVVGPQFTGADYSPFFSGTINNLVVTDSDFDTMSAGVIEFDDSSLMGVGTETVPISALTFDFDTFPWDGFTGNGVDTGAGNLDISPFSPVFTEYNDGGGVGNAAAFYNLSVSNLTGTGLTYVDGDLDSMDVSGDLTVELRLGQAPTFPPAVFTGTFSTSGLTYTFDVVDTQSAAIFTDIKMRMTRTGTATSTPIPEPTTTAMLGAGVVALLALRRARVRA